jgi:hypothetical protein
LLLRQWLLLLLLCLLILIALLFWLCIPAAQHNTAPLRYCSCCCVLSIQRLLGYCILLGLTPWHPAGHSCIPGCTRPLQVIPGVRLLGLLLLLLALHMLLLVLCLLLLQLQEQAHLLIQACTHLGQVYSRDAAAPTCCCGVRVGARGRHGCRGPSTGP